MEEYVLVGKIVNTHGIKGELKIISDFELKSKVFKVNKEIFIGPLKEPFKISSYRHHQIFDMVTLNGLNDINDVLKYKNYHVYIKRSSLNLKDTDYLMKELIGFDVMENKNSLGKVIDIIYNSKQTLLKVKKTKEFYIPFVDNYILKVDALSKKIYTKNAEDLIL
ncbi:MAG TPA: ribosome maturation factor RimM [Bacilli bacterium]|nr:ribosome maturation factor RimM [Bacilli bacterium]